MDPRQIWREGAGQAKEKTIRAIWPALAEALDGGPGKPLGKDAESEQPLCHGCGARTGKLAIGRAGDDPVCGACAARRPYAGRRLARVTGWSAGRRA